MRTDRKLSVYEGIIESIKRDIALGIIAEGERLPSCRDMAMKLGINPNTVQRAYSELEAQGIIYTIPKKGVFIKPHGETTAIEQLQSNNSNAFSAIVQLKNAGVPQSELLKIIAEVYKND